MITIKIKTKNSAFVNDYGQEVARILRNIANDFTTGTQCERYLDINGNSVCEVRITK